MKQFLTLLALTCSMAGCVTTTQRGGDLTYTGGQPPATQYNGFKLTSINPDEMQSDATRPHIRNVSDIRASDKLIKLYSDLSWKAFAAKDYDSFLVARSLANNMASARMAQNITSTVLTHSFVANNGNAVLPGSSVGFMPAKLYGEKNRRADYEFGAIQLSSMLDQDASAPTQLTAGPGFFGMISSAYGQANPELQRQRDKNGWGQDSRSLVSMPVGSAYVATNKEGQKFIVENTAEGFVFYNTGSQPVRVNLEELDYFPILDEPSPLRKKAAPIVRNIADSIDSVYLPLLAKGDLGSNTYATQPSQIIVTSYPPIRKDLDAKGMIAATKADAEAGKKAYLTNQPYKMAVELMGTRRFETPEANSFIMKCGGGRIKSVRYEGDALEFIRLSCLDQGRLIYTQRMIVTDDFKFKTYASMREDKRLTDRVKNVLDDGSLLEAIASFVPGLGQLDAGVRCLGQESATVTANKIYSHFFDSKNYQMGVEKFVQDLLPEQSDPSYVSKALDCSLASGAIGSAAKGAMAAKAGYMQYAKSDRVAKVMDTLSLLNQNFVGPGAGKAWSSSFQTIDQQFGAASNAGKLLKTVYETAQGSMGVTSLAEQLAGHDGIKALVTAWAR